MVSLTPTRVVHKVAVSWGQGYMHRDVLMHFTHPSICAQETARESYNYLFPCSSVANECAVCTELELYQKVNAVLQIKIHTRWNSTVAFSEQTK